MADRTTTTTTGEVHVLMQPAALAEVMRGSGGPVFRHMIVVGERVKQRAIELAPTRTGNLKAHIVKRITSGPDGSPAVLVGVENVPYAIWVHEGANPHIIRARNAPLLVFWWDKIGALFFGPSVNHPGNLPNRFLVRALDAVQQT